MSLSEALVKPEVYESRRIQLTSPVLHIGSETQKLSPFEYVAIDRSVYLPDMDALAQALYAKDKYYLDEYIRCVEQRQALSSLLTEAFGDDWKQMTSPEGRPIFPVNRRSFRETNQPISDLRPMIRNGLAQVYIPGSSIKGAIRTAIAYHLLNQTAQNGQSEYQRSDIEQKIRDSMSDIRRNRKFADDKTFMNRCFTDFRLQSDRSGVKQGPHTDFMRAIHITDSEPLIEDADSNHRTVSEVMLISHTADWKAKYKSPLYVELIHNVDTCFQITIDTKLLQEFKSNRVSIPFTSIDDILEICQNFAAAQWQHERMHWLERMRPNPNPLDERGNSLNFNLSLTSIQQFYQQQPCPYGLRLGWASGLMGTTVGLLFSEGLRQQLRTALFPKDAPGFEVPKSRRVVANCNREIVAAPGWVTFEGLY